MSLFILIFIVSAKWQKEVEVLIILGWRRDCNEGFFYRKIFCFFDILNMDELDLKHTKIQQKLNNGVKLLKV